MIAPESIFASNFVYQQFLRHKNLKNVVEIHKNFETPEIRFLFKRPKKSENKIYGLSILFSNPPDLVDIYGSRYVSEKCVTRLLGEIKDNDKFGRPDIYTSEIIYDEKIGYDISIKRSYPIFFQNHIPVFHIIDDFENLILEIFRISDYLLTEV